MYGSPDNLGVAPRAMQEIFEIRASNPNKEFAVECYMVELYRDKVFPML